jgi:hypothetical protein
MVACMKCEGTPHRETRPEGYGDGVTRGVLLSCAKNQPWTSDHTVPGRILTLPLFPGISYLATIVRPGQPAFAALTSMVNGAFRGWSRRRAGMGWSSGGFGLWGGRVLLQLVENAHVVVSWIKFGPKRAPDSFFEGNVHVPQLVRRQPQRDDVADSHDDVVGNNLDPFWREILVESGLGEVIVDVLDRFVFIITQDDSQHDFPVIGCLLCFEHERDEKKPAEQDPFHGSISSVRWGKAQREAR